MTSDGVVDTVDELFHGRWLVLCQGTKNLTAVEVADSARDLDTGVVLDAAYTTARRLS
ncbi:hypothetical protein K2224_28705 (plasmid) [Streptomyces sp. BHT-5-2]|uniref:hypothetical protein n=1 Tax=Streptomyces sp. BHT-5-2 TaxID=2866715 RepID=UPI001C8ECF3E|nr:hypothetical protein [Streptomyces sp. BHT-5-2]QZL07265.1 hypothetical protein K2224_28705 [Streptomyces sp. BHT-5-2]